MMRNVGILCVESPTSDFLFPSIVRSICLCREIKKRPVWQTSNKVLQTDGFCICDTAQSCCAASHKRRTLCDPLSTFHTNAFSSRLAFLKQHTCRPREHTTFHSRTFVVSNTSTIHLLASKVGLDEFLCDVFEVTAPLRCTLCTTLPSHGDAALQLRPQFRHCTEPDQDFRRQTCPSVSFPAGTERILDFDAGHCEPWCIRQRFLNCDTVRSSSSHTYC